MKIGDRVVLQKDVKNVKGGSICTIVRELDENTFMVRFRDNYIGADKTNVRKSDIKEITSVSTEKIVNYRFLNGSVYVFDSKVVVNNLKEGDIGFIMGAEVKENEEEDIFTLDFGTEKIKLTKKFIDENMKLLEQMKDEFLDVFPDEDGNLVPYEEILIDEYIYTEKNNKNEIQKPNIQITSVNVNGFDFDLSEKGQVKTTINIDIDKIDDYINVLNNLKDFLKQ